MTHKNHWVDHEIRDQGTYRYTYFNDEERGVTVVRALCNSTNDMEDALIEALDAGMTAEEIADIQLGAIS